MPTTRELKAYHMEPFSMRFAKYLFNKHPEWLLHLQPEEHDDDGFTIRTLMVNLPSQNPAVPEPLTIDVDLGRILTVSWFKDPTSFFLRWHVDWVMYMPSVWEGLPAELQKDDNWGFAMVVEFVEKFLNEEWVAFWDAAGWLYAPPELLEERTGSEPWGVWRSWRGTYDRQWGEPHPGVRSVGL